MYCLVARKNRAGTLQVTAEVISVLISPTDFHLLSFIRKAGAGRVENSRMVHPSLPFYVAFGT